MPGPGLPKSNLFKIPADEDGFFFLFLDQKLFSYSVHSVKCTVDKFEFFFVADIKTFKSFAWA